MYRRADINTELMVFRQNRASSSAETKTKKMVWLISVRTQTIKTCVFDYFPFVSTVSYAFFFFLLQFRQQRAA